MVNEEVIPLRIVDEEDPAPSPEKEDYSELLSSFGLNQNKARASYLCFGGCASNCAFLLLDSMDPDRYPSTRILAANTDTQQFSEMLRPGTPKPQFLSKWARRVENYGFRMLPLGNQGGAGRDPEVGKAATEAAEEEIRKSYEGSRISILVANLGGGTGSGAAPVVAKSLGEKRDEMGSVAVLMTPFAYEGEEAFAKAQTALQEVTEHIPALVIRNQALFEIKPDSRYKKLVEDLKEATTGKAIAIVNEYALAPIIYALDRLIMHAASSVNRDPKDFMRLMRAGKNVYVGIYRSDEDGAPTEKEEIVEQLLNNPFLAKGIVSRAKIGMILFEGFLHEDTGYIASEIIAEMKGDDAAKKVELMPGHDAGQADKRSIFFIAVADDGPNFEALLNPEGNKPSGRARKHYVMAGGRAVSQEALETPKEKLMPITICVTPGGTRDKKMVERNLPLDLAKKIARFAEEFRDTPAELKKFEWNAIRKEAQPYLRADEEMTELQLLTFTNENQIRKIQWPVTPYLYLRYNEVGRRIDKAAEGDKEGAKADFEALCEEFRKETGHSLHVTSSTLFHNLTVPETKKRRFR